MGILCAANTERHNKKIRIAVVAAIIERRSAERNTLFLFSIIKNPFSYALIIASNMRFITY